MHCGVCNKPIDSEHGSIREEKGYYHIVANCHGDTHKRIFPIFTLKRLIQQGLDVEKIPMFVPDDTPILPRSKVRDPDSVTTLKALLKEVLNENRPEWYRCEGGWNAQAISLIKESFETNKQVAQIRMEKNELVGIARKCISDLMGIEAGTKKVPSKSELEMRLHLLNSLVGKP